MMNKKIYNDVKQRLEKEIESLKKQIKEFEKDE